MVRLLQGQIFQLVPDDHLPCLSLEVVADFADLSRDLHENPGNFFFGLFVLRLQIAQLLLQDLNTRVVIKDLLAVKCGLPQFLLFFRDNLLQLLLDIPFEHQFSRCTIRIHIDLVTILFRMNFLFESDRDRLAKLTTNNRFFDEEAIEVGHIDVLIERGIVDATFNVHVVAAECFVLVGGLLEFVQVVELDVATAQFFRNLVLVNMLF